jgi:DNA-binding IclR family transcriptional regulator
VNWTDGRLIYRQGRGRKKHPMKQEYIAKEFKIGKRKLKEILSELSTANILRYDRAEKAYFVNREFIKKGSASQ